MFIPIHDDNPLRSIRMQAVTIGLIVLNCLVYLVEATGMSQAAIASFALVPGELFGAGAAGGTMEAGWNEVPVPEKLTLLTYMFFHGDIFHLLSNMIFLWVFGDNVEDALGHFNFLIFYLACGVAAGLTHAFMTVTPMVPLVGASGAVAGVIGAYLLLHPRVRIWVLVFRFIPIRVSAAFALGAWILVQVAMLVIPSGYPVAWGAHIGGLVAGSVLVLVLRRKGVMLFDRGLA